MDAARARDRWSGLSNYNGINEKGSEQKFAFTSDIIFPFLCTDCLTFTDLNCHYGRLGLCARRVGLDEENFRVRLRHC